MPVPLHQVQDSQLWCGRSDLHKLLCTNRQEYPVDEIIGEVSADLFPNRGPDYESDTHFHLWGRSNLAYGLMICIEDPHDIPEFLIWCVRLDWRPIIAPEMYSQPYRTALMLNYIDGIKYALKYSHFASEHEPPAANLQKVCFSLVEWRKDLRI